MVVSCSSATTNLVEGRVVLGVRVGLGVDAKNLANVNVGAVLVDLRVVGTEGGRVQAVGGLEPLARVVGLDDVGLLAVRASVAEADNLADLEVLAGLVNGGVVDYSELEGRDTVLGGCRVGMIAGEWTGAQK